MKISKLLLFASLFNFAIAFGNDETTMPTSSKSEPINAVESEKAKSKEVARSESENAPYAKPVETRKREKKWTPGRY